MTESRTKRSCLAASLLLALAALACILFVREPTLVGSAWGAFTKNEGATDGASSTSQQPYRTLPWMLALMPHQRAEALQVPARGGAAGAGALRGGAPAATIALRPAPYKATALPTVLKPQTAFTESDPSQYMPNPALLARSNANFWSSIADAFGESQHGLPLTQAQRQEFQSTMGFVDRRKPDALD